MISSTSNAQVKNVIQLLTKSRIRSKQKSYIIEGVRMYQEIPKDLLIKTYVSETFFGNAGKDIKGEIENSEYELVSDEVFRRMSDTITPQGIMAVVRQNTYSLENIMDGTKGLYMILEDLQDPGNLGTILRTAEAAGVSGIIMSKSTVDIYNPKVVRSTMGSIFRVPFVYVDNLVDAITVLKDKGVTIYAAHLEGENSYFNYNYVEPSAFIIGNEGNGLSDVMADAADILIKIPMLGRVESLNAAGAASILMYEALRQRIK